MKFLLFTLLGCLLTAQAMAHGLIRNELWIQRDGDHVRIRIAATLDEILLAQNLHPDDDRAIAVDTLNGAINKHAAYVAKHLAMTAPDGKVLKFTPSGLKLAEKLASQLLPSPGAAESGGVAMVPPSRLSPETTRVSYEFVAKLPARLRDQPLTLTHKLLADIPTAHSTTFVVYKVRVKTGDQPIVTSQLRQHDSMTVPPLSAPAPAPSSAKDAAKRPAERR